MTTIKENPFIEITRHTNRLLKPIFRRSWVVLLVTMLGVELFHQYFTYLMRVASEHSSAARIPGAIGDVFVSLLEFVVLIMLIPQRALEIDKNQEPGSFWQFNLLHFKALTIEGIRAFSVCLLWLMLLIIPGVVKYVRYFFVPYIVVANPEYQAGRVDALKESDRLVRGISWPLFIIILALTGVEFWQQSLREKHYFINEPFWSMIETVGFFAVNYYTNVWLFVLYQHRAKRLPKGA